MDMHKKSNYCDMHHGKTIASVLLRHTFKFTIIKLIMAKLRTESINLRTLSNTHPVVMQYNIKPYVVNRTSAIPQSRSLVILGCHELVLALMFLSNALKSIKRDLLKTSSHMLLNCLGHYRGHAENFKNPN